MTIRNESQDRERFISIIEESREIDISALMAATTSQMLEAFLPDVTLITLDQADELRGWYNQ